LREGAADATGDGQRECAASGIHEESPTTRQRSI